MKISVWVVGWVVFDKFILIDFGWSLDKISVFWELWWGVWKEMGMEVGY